MIKLYKPSVDELWFREKMLEDKETMSFNHAYGGTIDFPKKKWQTWYERWLGNNPDRFYRYLVDENNNFIGELAYYLDNHRYSISIIIYAKYRHMGYGKQALQILIDEAKNAGIDALYDDIAIDNPAIDLFHSFGFTDEEKTENYISVKKILD